MTTPTLIELPELEQGDIDRFYRYVKMADPESCWEWQSTRNNSGYGKFWLHGRTDLAHRVSYRIANGPIPNGHQIRHMCDNPTCVNPRHLLTGTGKQNARDALNRGRYRWGDRNGRAKLTEDQVCEIKTCWSAGESQVSMAKRFRVSRAAIQWILNGKNWTRLNGGAES